MTAAAKEAGVDVEKWEGDRKSEVLVSALKADMEFVKKLKVQGTPFFFGWVPSAKYGLITQGSVTKDSLDGIIEELRQGGTMTTTP